jgi:hypothetical protein
MAMNPDQIEALSSMLGGEDAGHFGGGHGHGAAPAPSERNNPNAGQNPLFKTVIKTGPKGAVAAAAAPAPEAAVPAPKAKVDTRAIWSPEEIAAARELQEDFAESSGSDGRRKPDYDVLYSQNLRVTDVFMGSVLSEDDGTTRSAKGIVVKVKLPGTKSMAQVQLDVTPTRLQVRSDD